MSETVTYSNEVALSRTIDVFLFESDRMLVVLPDDTQIAQAKERAQEGLDEATRLEASENEVDKMRAGFMREQTVAAQERAEKMEANRDKFLPSAKKQTYTLRIPTDGRCRLIRADLTTTNPRTGDRSFDAVEYIARLLDGTLYDGANQNPVKPDDLLPHVAEYLRYRMTDLVAVSQEALAFA